ncbi:MAG: TRAP transporter large permease subunit [Pseudomonadota bacterium]
MDQALGGVFLIVVMLALLAGGVWVAFSLLGVAWLAFALFTSAPILKVLPTTVWSIAASWPLTALPLFIWMGEILFRTRLAADMFRGLEPWLTRLPGRHLHVNVLACGIFAAVCGSSAATAATIGRMTLSELETRGYNRRLSLGSLAASGSLGMLIPPSIVMIVYGITAEVSIARLFIAGVIPGLVLMALFMSYIMLWSVAHPSAHRSDDKRFTWRESFIASRSLMPILLLIVAVIGSIYGGIATPTEAAVVGVVGSLAIAYATGGLTRRSFIESLTATTRTSCMIMFILVAAAFLTAAMGFLGTPKQMGAWISAMKLGPYELIAILIMFYIVLGCFLDGISMIVLTMAVVVPAVQAVGIDLVWFGIFVVIVIEMSQITPPVGFNLFVVQSLTGTDIIEVARASMPFFLLMIVLVVLITVFPEIVTFLPRTMTHG